MVARDWGDGNEEWLLMNRLWFPIVWMKRF